MKTTGYLNLGCALLSAGIFASYQSVQKNEESQQSTLPNIVIIYTDDQGYGDAGAYGATELKTPNIDKLVEGGVRFTKGYASSETCTPSRYALLTGEYPWKYESARILNN